MALLKDLTLFRKIIGILLILNVIFIWGNSFLKGSFSWEISNKVTDEVQIIYEDIKSTPDTKVQLDENQYYSLSKLVRKAAHIIEFFVLGIWASLFMSDKKITPGSLRNIFGFAFAVAFIDETIQLFITRTSKIADVWLDLLGFSISAVIVLLIKFIKYSRKTSLQK